MFVDSDQDVGSTTILILSKKAISFSGHGRTRENDVYLVDFGLVSKYHRDGVHLEYKPDARKAHDGTIGEFKI